MTGSEIPEVTPPKGVNEEWMYGFMYDAPEAIRAYPSDVVEEVEEDEDVEDEEDKDEDKVVEDRPGEERNQGGVGEVGEDET